ncbi:MAG TPA: PBS lyase, partial [Desulfobulbaceae bacterium]|nr:PBS lyase [Desulfobulbaceae bacterium]
LDDKKALRLLQRFLYDPNEDARWRLAWLIGEICAKVASRDPGQVSELLHRLFEACSDSAATPWGMIETMGTVIALRPDIFGAFTRHLLNFAGQPSTRNQTLWALAEIAASRPDLIRNMPFYALLPMLQHEDATTRGLLARLLGRIKAKEAAMQMLPLTDDISAFVCWQKGARQMTTVRDEAQQALAAIQSL